MRTAIDRCNLDLSGGVVLTEAATGAYVVTSVIAAMAGADWVFALAGSCSYGPASEATCATLELAKEAGVAHRIEIVTEKSERYVSDADIVTNSGHLRPIDAEMIGWMKDGAVIPLMYEKWELRSSDVDLAACRARGVAVAGTNESDPAVDVFSYLGAMAVKQLLDAGLAVYGNRILCLCDNAFVVHLERGWVGMGADVTSLVRICDADSADHFDAIVVALEPGNTPVLTATDAKGIAEHWPDAIVAQFWGDIDRAALKKMGIAVWPAEAPAPGHMGILPSAIGPEPVVRLQAGGLKVGERLWRASIAGGADPPLSPLAKGGIRGVGV
jgi:hypothetical protein